MAGLRQTAQRAQSFASCDMILMIDADERVTPELRQAIERVLEAPQATPFTASAAVIFFWAIHAPQRLVP